MKAFIKPMDETVWKAILSSWDHSIKKDDNGESVKKLKIEWIAVEDRSANSNSKALNAIFEP